MRLVSHTIIFKKYTQAKQKAPGTSAEGLIEGLRDYVAEEAPTISEPGTRADAVALTLPISNAENA